MIPIPSFDIEQVVRNKVASKAASFSGFTSPSLSGFGGVASAASGLTGGLTDSLSNTAGNLTGAAGQIGGAVGNLTGAIPSASSISNLANGPLGSIKGLLSAKMNLAKSLLPTPPAVPGIFNGVKKGGESYIKSMSPGTIIPSGLTTSLTLPSPMALSGGGTTTSAIAALKDKVGGF